MQFPHTPYYSEVEELGKGGTTNVCIIILTDKNAWFYAGSPTMYQRIADIHVALLESNASLGVLCPYVTAFCGSTTLW